MKKDIDPKINKIQDSAVRKRLKKDINILQISPDERSFAMATKLFLQK